MSELLSNNILDLQVEGKIATLKLHSSLTLEVSDVFEKALSQIYNLSSLDKFIFDCTNLKSYDSYFVVFFNRIKEFTDKNNIHCEITGLTKDLETFIDLLTPKELEKTEIVKKNKITEFFESIGEAAQENYKDAYDLVEFVGNLFIRILNIFIKPTEVRWKDLPYFVTRSGINALPIAVLIVFLIGLITGYQGAVQLEQFGADIYVADLIGISLTRELAPLMAAIIIAGRSGSAYAAEIGTMKVSEEIDSLETMGYDKMNFLVIPRVFAVTLALPIIVLICDVAGIIGGLISALLTLDITITAYLTQLNLALSIGDIMTGLIKSAVFGFMIATIGCFRGLQVKGGAESVGRYTTASVVTSIFLIIVVDAAFVFLFQALNI